MSCREEERGGECGVDRARTWAGAPGWGPLPLKATTKDVVEKYAYDCAEAAQTASTAVGDETTA